MPLSKLRNLLRRPAAHRGGIVMPSVLEEVDEIDLPEPGPARGPLTEQEAQVVADFAAHLPSLSRGRVLDLGSPDGRVGLQVLKGCEESAVTYVHPCWDRVADALISVGEELRRQPGQRSRMSYHVSQLTALDVSFVSYHRYLTWVGVGDCLDQGVSGGEATWSSRTRASLEVLLEWYAALTRNHPQVQTRLLLGVSDSDAGTLAALASLHGLEVEASQVHPGAVAVFELHHRFMESIRGSAEMKAMAA
ncbi:hypothetical protein [Verrucomicrobium sp. BvORR106]|uniref:hypothetical protein n=1 Tax=Verrucomicrobium sp. BvORR106 TaxID=1403819 RepID=UPI00056DC0C6|nr:hypothetical protein [Verrucomicrobium sp. BvORR106]